MSLNKTKVLSCSLYILSGLLLSICGLTRDNEIDIPHEKDNYSYNPKYEDNNVKVVFKYNNKEVKDDLKIY